MKPRDIAQENCNNKLRNEIKLKLGDGRKDVPWKCGK
jgi:hypothetical protein